MLDFGFATEKEIRGELGNRMQVQRLAQEMTQVELAERAGIHVNTLRALESKGQCTLENFIRVAMGLGLAGELQSLLSLEIQSVSRMEWAEAKRVRAPRKSAITKRLT